MTIETANCDCIAQMNASIKEQISPLYSLPVQGFIGFNGAPSFVALCIPLMNNKTNKAVASPPVQVGFCPFCGKKNKTEEEVAAIHAQKKAGSE